VTRAMELAPYKPSFLDMRDAILVADTAVYDGAHHTAIWKVFAHRGMGFNAGSLGDDDTRPAASFAVPPASAATGTIHGTATDDADHPLAGVAVTLVFQGSGPANPTDVTGADGQYTLPNIPVGHYAELIARGSGLSARQDVTVGSGTNTVDFQPHNNFAGP